MTINDHESAPKLNVRCHQCIIVAYHVFFHPGFNTCFFEGDEKSPGLLVASCNLIEVFSLELVKQ